MSANQWIVTGYLMLSILITWYQVDRPREPINWLTALIATMLTGLLIALVVTI